MKGGLVINNLLVKFKESNNIIKDTSFIIEKCKDQAYKAVNYDSEFIIFNYKYKKFYQIYNCGSTVWNQLI